MKQYQITQVYGQGNYGYLYFEAPDDTDVYDLSRMAAYTVRSHWKNVISGPSKLFGVPHTPCRPTVHVAEYADGRRVRGGHKFKVVWR